MSRAPSSWSTAAIARFDGAWAACRRATNGARLRSRIDSTTSGHRGIVDHGSRTEGGPMRSRRKSIAPWLFLFGALLLAVAVLTALFVRFQPEHEISERITEFLRVATGDWLDVLRVLGGLAIAAWGTAFTL